MKIYKYKKEILLVLLIAVLVVLWFSTVIFSNNILIQRDLTRYFYPLRKFGTESIKNFHVPLWNPYISCGKPFLASLQTVVLYPISLVYYLLPSFDLAFNWYIVIHFFLAGVFMYLLMRHWYCGNNASLISAIIFMFSGYLSSVVSMNTSLSGAVWLPLILLFFSKAMKTHRVVFILLTSVFLAVQFLGGIPTPIYSTLWLLLFYLICVVWYENYKNSILKDGVRSLIIFAVIIIIAFLISTFQILPFKELIGNSNLAGGRSIETISKWSLTPVELFGFIIPYIRGDINVPSGHLGPQEWLISFYVGIPALIFTVLLFILKPCRKSYFFGGVFLISLLIALGKYTPVYPFLCGFLPGLSNMRYPVKFILLTTFSLSVMGGMGFDALLGESREEKKKVIVFWFLRIAFIFALLLGVLIFYWYEIGTFFLGNYIKDKGITGDLFNQHVFVYLNDSKNLCQSFIVFVVSALLLIVFLKNKLRKSLFSCLFIILIIGDLIAVNMGINKVMDKRQFALVPDTIELLKEDKTLFRTYQTKEIWELNRQIFGLSYSEGMCERKKTFACNMAMDYGIFSTRGYGSIDVDYWYDFILFLEALPIKAKLKLLGLLNVKYIISMNPIEEEGVSVVYKGKIYSVTTIDGTRAYKFFYISSNPYYLPRAFLVPDGIFVDDESVILGIMENENFDPQRIVVLEGDKGAEGTLVKRDLFVDLGNDKEFAKIINYEPDEIIIETRADEPKWLVLSDTYYPGWQVFIDGQKGYIYKADYFIRAVLVPGGEHTVKFVYNPASFKIGLIISIITILFILFIFAFLLFKKQ